MGVVIAQQTLVVSFPGGLDRGCGGMSPPLLQVQSPGVSSETFWKHPQRFRPPLPHALDSSGPSGPAAGSQPLDLGPLGFSLGSSGFCSGSPARHTDPGFLLGTGCPFRVLRCAVTQARGSPALSSWRDMFVEEAVLSFLIASQAAASHTRTWLTRRTPGY